MCRPTNDSGGKVSVLFWLEFESLESALRGESGIHDTRIQGQHLLRLEGPILDQLFCKIEELPDLRAARRPVRRPLRSTRPKRYLGHPPRGNSTGAQSR
jgi:hypothetical protein